MWNHGDVFTNRTEAGKQLGEALVAQQYQPDVVFGVPRGGVEVAYEVAKKLERPLDAVVPRKIGAPGQEELGIGAVASWGTRKPLLDSGYITMLRVSDAYIQSEAHEQAAEAERRLLAYRGTSEPADVKDKRVLVVDDGIATGYTLRAAINSLREIGAKEVGLAVPVAPPDVVREFERITDMFLVLETPSPFYAVGNWYADFRQTSDDEVLELLRKAKAWGDGSPT